MEPTLVLNFIKRNPNHIFLGGDLAEGFWNRLKKINGKLSKQEYGKKDYCGNVILNMTMQLEITENLFDEYKSVMLWYWSYEDDLSKTTRTLEVNNKTLDESSILSVCCVVVKPGYEEIVLLQLS